MKLKKILLTVLVLMLSACGAKENKQTNQVKEEVTVPKDEIVTQKERSESEKKQKSETAEQSFDQEQFIINTFANYNYQVPDKSQWLVKEEGTNKVAVIIKENLNHKGKPDISKLIFLVNLEGEPEILHLMIKNQVII